MALTAANHRAYCWRSHRDSRGARCAAGCAQGFLPEAVDIWIQDYLYPAYSWIMLGFLAGSSLYGLFKTGKLPGQTQQQ